MLELSNLSLSNVRNSLQEHKVHKIQSTVIQYTIVPQTATGRKSNEGQSKTRKSLPNFESPPIFHCPNSILMTPRALVAIDQSLIPTRPEPAQDQGRTGTHHHDPPIKSINDESPSHPSHPGPRRRNHLAIHPPSIILVLINSAHPSFVSLGTPSLPWFSLRFRFPHPPATLKPLTVRRSFRQRYKILGLLPIEFPTIPGLRSHRFLHHSSSTHHITDQSPRTPFPPSSVSTSISCYSPLACSVQRISNTCFVAGEEEKKEKNLIFYFCSRPPSIHSLLRPRPTSTTSVTRNLSVAHLTT